MLRLLRPASLPCATQRITEHTMCTGIVDLVVERRPFRFGDTLPDVTGLANAFQCASIVSEISGKQISLDQSYSLIGYRQVTL